MRPLRHEPRPSARAATRTVRSRAARPAFEPLERRTLLSTAAAPYPAVTAAASQDNQAYVAGLIGANRLWTPQEAAIGRRLVAELDRGVPKERVVLNLLQSRPARAVNVQTSYVALLGRNPSPAELRAGIARLQRFGDDRALEVALVSSREFYQLRGGGTDAGFLDALYRVVLHRSPTTAEQTTGVRALAGRASRAVMARWLLSQPEAKTILLDAARSLADPPLAPGSPGSGAARRPPPDLLPRTRLRRRVPADHLPDARPSRHCRDEPAARLSGRRRLQPQQQRPAAGRLQPVPLPVQLDERRRRRRTLARHRREPLHLRPEHRSFDPGLQLPESRPPICPRSPPSTPARPTSSSPTPPPSSTSRSRPAAAPPRPPCPRFLEATRPPRSPQPPTALFGCSPSRAASSRSTPPRRPGPRSPPAATPWPRSASARPPTSGP